LRKGHRQTGNSAVEILLPAEVEAEKPTGEEREKRGKGNPHGEYIQ